MTHIDDWEFRSVVKDGHQFTWFIRDDTPIIEFGRGASYFDSAVASIGWPDTYIGDLGMARTDYGLKHEREWPLSWIVMALIRAALTIEGFGEYPENYWDQFPLIPPEELRRIPQAFSLLARKR